MKIDIESPTIFRSKNFVEINYEIGDPIAIMEILRQKMYSNPIKSICQEIMSNARDAHIEVGKTDVPIKVSLPTKDNPTWVCQDFGPGISPSRIVDVYTKFGCSTKKSDNSQIGGFGLGSKVIFAYTDSCLITTICNVEGHHIKYQYTTIIGENRGLKLIQLQDPVGTEESCGTTISINVARNDMSSFSNYTYQVSAYWMVRPTIIHPDDSNQFNKTGDYIYEEGDFKIAASNHPFCRNPVILVYKIPYTIDGNIFRNLLDPKEYDFFFRNPCLMEFGNGELSISSNRETLYFDDKTKDKIVKKIKLYFKKTVEGINTNINKFNSYKEAIQYWNNIPSEIRDLDAFKWRDIVINRHVTLPERNEAFFKYVSIIVYGRDRLKWKFKQASEVSVLGAEHILLDSTFRKFRDVIQYYQTNNNFDGNIYIIKIEHGFIAESKNPKETLEMVNENIKKYFSYLNPIPFESLPQRPAAEKSASIRESYKKTILYKFESCRNLQPCPIENISDEDFNSIKYYVGIFGGKVIPSLDPNINRYSPEFQSFNWDNVARLFTYNKDINDQNSLIGIQKDKFNKIGDNWIYLADYLKEKINKEREQYGLLNENDFANYLITPSRYGITNLLSDNTIKFILENQKKFNTMLVNLAKVIKIRRDTDKAGTIVSKVGERIHSQSIFKFIGSEFPKYTNYYREEVDKLFPLLSKVQYPDADTFPEILEYLIQKSKSLKGTP
jgi:hypothetical protein